MAEQVLPRDTFDVRLRELSDNPGAVKVSARINRADFYGRTETWIMDTFRVDGQSEAFVVKVTSEATVRLHLPQEVMRSLGATMAVSISRTRKRAARKALATKRAEGQQIGNPAALEAARKAGKRGTRKKKGGRR